MHIITSDKHPSLRRWLWLGWASLALGGLFSLLLVSARTPQVQSYIPFKDFFHTALVVHVDLTVLVWFLANACLLFGACSPWNKITETVTKAAQLCLALGMVLMVVAGFVPDAHPLLNNYVPVLQHDVFFLSLGFVAAGVVLMCGQAIVGKTTSTEHAQHILIPSAAFITLCAFAALIASRQMMPEGLDAHDFYEVLFWGGGHLLQFTHTQLLMLVWLGLAAGCGLKVGISPRVVSALGIFAVLAVMSAIVPYARGTLADGFYRHYFTQLMIWANGVYLIPVAIFVIIAAWPVLRGQTLTSEQKPVFAALLASLLLFAAGGVISMRIEGVNVIIPAHYHGSIVGVSLAYMGLFYLLLPKVGAGAVTGKWAVAQPWVYGVGQLIHITGLMISGGYEVARKTVLLEPDAAFGARFGMGLMGFGGLIAIVGGVIFVVLVYRSLRKSR